MYRQISATKRFWTVVHEGPPRRTPTLTSARDPGGRKIAGKSAICPFCQHVHPLAVHRRLTDEGKAEDALLVVADHSEITGKTYRSPDHEDRAAASDASEALRRAAAFVRCSQPFLMSESRRATTTSSAQPSTVLAPMATSCAIARRSHSFVLARTIRDVGQEIRAAGATADYARALSGYAAAVVARKLRTSTRGCTLYSNLQKIRDIYVNQGSIGFSQDFFEAGIGEGPGTWDSLSRSSASTLRGILDGIRGQPVVVERGTATKIDLRDGSAAAVVTDPPYDQMLAYADSSDLIYSWIKRCLHTTWPELVITADPHGTQEKADEIIVKRVRGEAPNEHGRVSTTTSRSPRRLPKCVES